MSIYVCSDIHGQFEMYHKMLAEIRFSDEDHLYILGDMIDRGPDGVKILLDASARPNVTCLIGNHEYMMWNYLRYSVFSQGGIWLDPNNGGKQTLSAFRDLPPEEKRRIQSFIADLYLQIEITVADTRFLLSHSSFLPGFGTVKWRENVINKKQVSYVVWNSPWRYYEYTAPEEYGSDGRYHIIGHVPVPMIDRGYWPERHMPQMPCFFHDKDNRIVNIDLGCAMIPRIMANSDDFEESFKRIPSLCVLELERFARGEEKPAVYISPLS